jgi:hypothetical protein
MRQAGIALAFFLSTLCSFGLAMASVPSEQDDDPARGFIDDDAEHAIVVARLERQEYLGGLSDDNDPDAIIMDGVIRGRFRLRRVVAGKWTNRTFSGDFVAHTYFVGHPTWILLVNKKPDGEHTIRAYRGVSKGFACLPERLLARYNLTGPFTYKPPSGQKGLCAKI